MKNIEEINRENVKKISAEKKLPDFFPGDIIKVGVRITEGKRERIQYFEGVCIAKKNAGLNSSFTVRKISYGEGIERVLPYYSPQISKIEVVKRGDVRRSKLYYLRGRSGKSARITEKTSFSNNDNLKKNNIDNGVKKTVEVSEKTLKSEETSLKDSSKKSESLKENVSTEKKETTDKETNKKITSPSLEDKK